MISCPIDDDLLKMLRLNGFAIFLLLSEELHEDIRGFTFPAGSGNCSTEAIGG